MLLVARQNAPARDAWLGEFRATLALAWPMVLTNLAQIALTTTDVIVVGRLGASALAAATLGVNLYFGLLIFAIGLVSATSPMMAEVIGRNHRVVREVRRTFRQGLWSAVIVSVPAWALLWHTEAVLLALGQEPQLAADAHLFMRELQWGFLPALGFIALRSFVAALERPVWAMLVTGIAILFNIAANWALVFGHLGLPALGLRGSGLATTLSNTFLFLGLVVVVLADRQFRRFRLFGRFHLGLRFRGSFRRCPFLSFGLGLGKPCLFRFGGRIHFGCCFLLLLAAEAEGEDAFQKAGLFVFRHACPLCRRFARRAASGNPA